MSWTAKLERIPAMDREALIKKLEGNETIRNIECEVDPEHPDYCLCSYQEFVEPAKT